VPAAVAEAVPVCDCPAEALSEGEEVAVAVADSLAVGVGSPVASGVSVLSMVT
jgi:hypothetical protein